MLSLYAEGTREEVVAAITAQAVKEKARFAKEMAEYQVFDGFDGAGKIRHRPAPITDSVSSTIIDAVIVHMHEQIDHLAAGEPCSFSFQLTIHRRNPN